VGSEGIQEKEGASRLVAPSLFQLTSLRLAPVAGGATIGGRTACWVRRLHRPGKSEGDNRHQHNRTKLLHGFSPLKSNQSFLSADSDTVSE